MGAISQVHNRDQKPQETCGLMTRKAEFSALATPLWKQARQRFEVAKSRRKRQCQFWPARYPADVGLKVFRV
jgi:hypothetical protein